MTKEEARKQMTYHKEQYRKYRDEWKKHLKEEREVMFTLQKEYGVWEGYLMFRKLSYRKQMTLE